MSARCVAYTLALSVAFYALAFGLLWAVGAFGSCETHACWQRVHEARAERWCQRHTTCLVRRQWRAQPAGWRSWAISTARCESNLRWSIANGNGYYGGHQWIPPTWYHAVSLLPRKIQTREMPHRVSWRLQSLAAIAYARRYGTGAWPVCG